MPYDEVVSAMLEGLENSSELPRCGDCHAPLPANREPEAPSSQDYYCPKCAGAVREPFRCPECGSLVCGRCGTPLEIADELGIG